jgi:hypothetical protein
MLINRQLRYLVFVPNPFPTAVLISKIKHVSNVTPVKWLTYMKHNHFEKLTVTHPVKKFALFYRIRHCILLFKTTRHWTLSWARCFYSSPSITRFQYFSLIYFCAIVSAIQFSRLKFFTHFSFYMCVFHRLLMSSIYIWLSNKFDRDLFVKWCENT